MEKKTFVISTLFISLLVLYLFTECDIADDRYENYCRNIGCSVINLIDMGWYYRRTPFTKAVIDLYGEQGLISSQNTDSEGRIIFENLADGTYYIICNFFPDGVGGSIPTSVTYKDGGGTWTVGFDFPYTLTSKVISLPQDYYRYSRGYKYYWMEFDVWWPPLPQPHLPY